MAVLYCVEMREAMIHSDHCQYKFNPPVGVFLSTCEDWTQNHQVQATRLTNSLSAHTRDLISIGNLDKESRKAA
jgi:hypothetical protein